MGRCEFLYSIHEFMVIDERSLMFVRDSVVNEVRRDVARDVVHFGGEVGHPGRWTCRRTRRRSVPCQNDEGQGGRHHRSRRRVSVTSE